MAYKVNKANFQSEVISASVPVVVDFSAAWCGPCKKLAPILAEISDEMEGTAKVVEVDAGTDPDLAQEFGVMSLPTIIFFKDGKVKERIVGLVAKDKILSKLKPLL